jgi:hypothetical protein
VVSVRCLRFLRGRCCRFRLAVRAPVVLRACRVITVLVLVGRRRVCRWGAPGWLSLRVAAVSGTAPLTFILRRVAEMAALT